MIYCTFRAVITPNLFYSLSDLKNLHPPHVIEYPLCLYTLGSRKHECNTPLFAITRKQLQTAYNVA